MTAQTAQRFQASDAVRMFPTIVWKAELAPTVCRPLNDSIMRTLAEIGAPLADLRHGESWQSDHELHGLDGLRKVVDWID